VVVLMLGDDLALALVDLRTQAASRMRDSVVIRRPAADQTIDDDTVVDGAEFALTPVYSGPCRVKSPGVQPQRVESAGATVTIQKPELHVPDDAPELKPGDVAFMAADTYTPRLRGKIYRVDDGHAATDSTAQRVPVTMLSGGAL
jgi:hypothetical protein